MPPRGDISAAYHIQWHKLMLMILCGVVSPFVALRAPHLPASGVPIPFSFHMITQGLHPVLDYFTLSGFIAPCLRRCLQCFCMATSCRDVPWCVRIIVYNCAGGGVFPMLADAPRCVPTTRLRAFVPYMLMRYHIRGVETMYHIVSLPTPCVCLLRRCNTSSLQGGRYSAQCTARCRVCFYGYAVCTKRHIIPQLH